MTHTHTHTHTCVCVFLEPCLVTWLTMHPSILQVFTTLTQSQKRKRRTVTLF